MFAVLGSHIYRLGEHSKNYLTDPAIGLGIDVHCLAAQYAINKSSNGNLIIRFKHTLLRRHSHWSKIHSQLTVYFIPSSVSCRRSSIIFADRISILSNDLKAEAGFRSGRLEVQASIGIFEDRRGEDRCVMPSEVLFVAGSDG